MQARLRGPVDAGLLRSRLAAAVARHPHLGAPPVVRVAADPEWPDVLADFADRMYRDAEPLVRVATTDAPPYRLLIAAHHGAVDGFGLLALLGIALDTGVTSNAAGIGERPAGRSFAASGVRRVAEALFAPPSRAASSVAHDQAPPSHAAGSGAHDQVRSSHAAGSGAHGPAPPSRAAGSGGPVSAGNARRRGPGRSPLTQPGDVVAVAELPVTKADTPAIVAAASAAIRDWNRDHDRATPRMVAALGASRRPGAALAPDRATAFFRLRVPPAADAATVRGLLERTAPEPHFPPSRARFTKPLIRALGNRLGATFLASNLGVVGVPATPAPPTSEPPEATGERPEAAPGDQSEATGERPRAAAGDQSEAAGERPEVAAGAGRVGVEALTFLPAPSGRNGLAVGVASCGQTTTVSLRAGRTGFDQAAAEHLLGLVVKHLTGE